MGPVVAFGPIMPGWGSWEWVGHDIAQELSRWFDTVHFHAEEIPEADAVVVIKHLLSGGWLEEASRRLPIIYCPVDYYGSGEDIDCDGVKLRHCARILIHCERLRRYFEPYAPVAYVDHHVKFVASPPCEQQKDGLILWVGVRSNLRPLVEWVNQHPLPGDLCVLTNLEDSTYVPQPHELGFRLDRKVFIENWSQELQTRRTAQARAALDIKGADFRSRHKPAAKALDFIASGLPLAMNSESSPVDHLSRMGFDIASPLDWQQWLSREYWEETRRFGAAIRELLTLERIGRRFRGHLDEVLAIRNPMRNVRSAPRKS